MKVALVMGSDSDMPIVQKACDTLAELGIPFEMRILSAHRTPRELADYAACARKNGCGVMIAFAGMAAHLAGAIAAQTTLPVIAVPCAGTAGHALNGLDALLSCVQMPTGVPVATVALNGGANAALLAAQILSLSDTRIASALAAQKTEMAAATLGKDNRLRER